MSPVRRLLPVLVVPVVLLASAGCSKSAGPTQEQYASMADGVCKDADEKIQDEYDALDVDAWEAAASGDPNTYVDRPERWFRARIVPEYESLSARLKGIRPPDGDAAYLSDLYADLDTRIEVLHNRPGDGRVVVDGDARLRERFESYGMEKCPVPAPEEESEGEGQ